MPKQIEEYPIDFLRVFFLLVAQDKVIGKPHQKGFPFHPRFDLLHIPTVEHLLQIDID